jgi:hypothetical protein
LLWRGAITGGSNFLRKRSYKFHVKQEWAPLRAAPLAAKTISGTYRILKPNFFRPLQGFIPVFKEVGSLKDSRVV